MKKLGQFSQSSASCQQRVYSLLDQDDIRCLKSRDLYEVRSRYGCRVLCSYCALDRRKRRSWRDKEPRYKKSKHRNRNSCTSIPPTFFSYAVARSRGWRRSSPRRSLDPGAIAPRSKNVGTSFTDSLRYFIDQLQIILEGCRGEVSFGPFAQSLGQLFSVPLLKSWRCQ